MTDSFVVVYAKAVDDKVEGVYIEGVYFGGISETQSGADDIATTCVNSTRGGSAIPKIFSIDSPQSLFEIFRQAKDRFNKLEIEMFQNEMLLESNQIISKNKKKKKKKG